MNMENIRAKAEAFRKMHLGPKLLLLPNCWDVASARIFADAGFPAIATTSAGIAFTLGYPDGQRITRDEMMAVVSRITAATTIPVTADAESGYGPRAEDAARTARAVIAAGAVGMNLEDGLTDRRDALADLSLQLERIRAIRETACDLGVPLVLNARTDVYLHEVGAPLTRYDSTMQRAAAYRDAGADCIFIPGVRDAETIRRFVTEVKHPINILAGPGSLPIPQLEQLGVARVTLGSSPMRATLGLVQRMATELKSTGTYESLAGAPSHSDINAMLK